MDNNNFSLCGENCKLCKYRGTLCDGCEKSMGKPYWTMFNNIEKCPIYECCRTNHGYAHCGECNTSPCAKFFETKKNNLDENAQLKNVNQRAAALSLMVDNATGACGFLCGKCKAYKPNIRKKDERAELKKAFKKYYDLDFTIEDLTCDGCKCIRGDAHRLDISCPIRPCVMNKELDNCSQCAFFPCKTFEERRGISKKSAKIVSGCAFNESEFEKYMSPYDNAAAIEKTNK